jgi:hypothetical protein
MSQNCSELDKIISQSQSSNKQVREQAQATISALRLDAGTTPVLFEYVTQESMFGEQNRLAVAVIIKNIVKKVYGVSMATSNLLLTNFYFSNTPTPTTTRHSASSTKPSVGTPRMTPARLSTRKAL